MAFALSVLLFVVALFAIVMIHEGGHYLAARAFNFRVLEYFVGFGPRLWSVRRGEIEYGVKAIPAGGYVKIAGMNPFENDVPEGDASRAYAAKPIWQRVVVIVAGPLSHFIVAWLIFAGVFFFAGNWSIPGIASVDPALNGRPSPAADAGMQPGDVIVRIGDLENPTSADIGTYQRAHVGQSIDYVVLRDGQPVTLSATPEEVREGQSGLLLSAANDGEVVSVEPAFGGTESPAAAAGVRPGDMVVQIGSILDPTSQQIQAYERDHVKQVVHYVVLRDGQTMNITMTPVDAPVPQTVRIGVVLSGVKEGPVASLLHAGGAVWDTTREAVVGLGHVFGPQGVSDTVNALFSNAQRPTNGGVSLIGVSQEAGHAGSQGAWAYFFTIFATVVLFIGLVNLLPVPPLDGGHVAIALLEKIGGHRIDMKKVVPVSAAVLLILGFFSISAIILDIWKPIQRP